MRRIAVQAVFDASPNPYMVLDRELRYVTANRAYLAVTGSTLEELVGKRLFDAFPHDPDDSHREPQRLLEASLRKVLETRERDVLPYIPYRVARGEGTDPELRIWTATHTPILDDDGEVEMILQHTEDVTALHQDRDERGLRAHAERMRRAVVERDARIREILAVFDQSPGFLVFLSGPEQVFEIVNREYERLVGRQQLVGRPAREALAGTVPETYFEPLDRAFATGTAIVARGLRLAIGRGAAGETEDVYLDYVIQPIKDDDGSTLGILVQGQDVTEHKRAALRNARLSREREELLARELEARQRAEAASRAKDDFLAMLGHELRNPLAPILTAVQLMRLRDGAANRRELEIIERQAEHMVRLVDDLLDVSRIVHGKIELRRAPVELAVAATKALEIASPLLHDGAHQLHVSVPPSGLRVDADEARLAQVIANLLTNAARYTPRGGRVWLDATRDGDEVVLRVRDTGIGMAPDALEKVFEMFQQGAPRSPHAQGSGLGIGLTLVRRITELHGGRVSATSSGPGQGSEFTVRLPALAIEEADRARGAAGGAGQLACARRVLIIDDNTDAAELLGELVSRRGHEVVLAHDGADGLAKLVDDRPDIAVIDIGLPSMNGYEVAQRARDALGAGAPTMIALTGYGSEGDRARSQSAGFSAHLTKPVDSRRLLALLESSPPAP